MKKTAYVHCILEFEYDEEIPKEALDAGIRDILSEDFDIHMCSVILDD